MTITVRVRLALAACLVATPVLAQSGQPRPGDLMKEGQRVEVIDDQGREIKGRVGVMSVGTVRLVRDGKTTEIPFDRITQISRPPDSLANGALIGLAAGAAYGLLGSTVGTSDCDYYGPCYNEAAFVIGSTLAFGGIGAGIGVGVDALIRRNRVIYRRDTGVQTRLAPVVAPGVKGVVVAMRW
jgi:hypothetical protein